MPEHIFYIRPWTGRLLLACGSLQLGMGVLGFLYTGEVDITVMALGAFLMAIGYLHQWTPIVTLHTDHLEIKRAPVSRRTSIQYRSVRNLVTADEGRLEVHWIKQDEPQKTAISLNWFVDTDQTRLLSLLRERTSAAEPV